VIHNKKVINLASCIVIVVVLIAATMIRGYTLSEVVLIVLPATLITCLVVMRLNRITMQAVKKDDQADDQTSHPAE
jgi:hypothetical protein